MSVLSVFCMQYNFINRKPDWNFFGIKSVLNQSQNWNELKQLLIQVSWRNYNVSITVYELSSGKMHRETVPGNIRINA